MDAYRHNALIHGQVSMLAGTFEARKTASHTSGKWNAIRCMPLDQALIWMERDGWDKVASSECDVFSYFVLVYGSKTVRLYARNSVVRMIHVANAK